MTQQFVTGVLLLILSLAGVVLIIRACAFRVARRRRARQWLKRRLQAMFGPHYEIGSPGYNAHILEILRSLDEQSTSTTGKGIPVECMIEVVHLASNEDQQEERV